MTCKICAALNKVRDTEIGPMNNKEYLRQLLIAVVKEGECFSGKRPFGNSGWGYALEEMAWELNPSVGEWRREDSEDSWLEITDYKRFDAVMDTVISHLFLVQLEEHDG